MTLHQGASRPGRVLLLLHIRVAALGAIGGGRGEEFPVVGWDEEEFPVVG